MKEGYIVLIPKEDGILNMGKYRGITLNNVDLKSFSKMLNNRLSPYLMECIHESQYSVPGKKEWEINSLLRDIFHEMDDQNNDSFLLAVDFRKAFDSVIPSFLYKVMEKMGFPIKFISVIRLIDDAAVARVIINEALSEYIAIDRG